MTSPSPPVSREAWPQSRGDAGGPQRFPLLVRGFSWLSRFSSAVSNLGLYSSLKLFAYYYLRISPRETTLRVRKLKRLVYFRGAADIGVMAHFYRPGYRIRDTVEHPVRFIIDAGANIGDETLRFRFFHPEAMIVALEPAHDNFRLLVLNTQDDPRIAALENGLWSRECKLKIHPGCTNEEFRVSEVLGPGEPFDVLSVSIPSLLERFRIDAIDILKMDMEGAEYFVFSENTESWIHKVKVLIFECPDNDHPGTTLRIFQALNGLEFDCYLQNECIVLIRRDTGWRVETDLFLARPGRRD